MYMFLVKKLSKDWYRFGKPFFSVMSFGTFNSPWHLGIRLKNLSMSWIMPQVVSTKIEMCALTAGMRGIGWCGLFWYFIFWFVLI